MKVNVVDSRTNHQKVLQYMIDSIPQFADEYDIDPYIAIDWVMTNITGIDAYSKWMTDKRVLNTSLYSLVDDNGERIAIGFDIMEDELFTLMMMKLK